MIFLGDIASPDSKTSEQLEKCLNEYSSIFTGKRLICNFEGLISKDDHSTTNHPVLYNNSAVPFILNRGIPPILCLANNHTLDLPAEFDNTVDILERGKIPYCGAGKSKDASLSPLKFSDGDRQIILFNAVWDFLLYRQKNPSKGVYVAEINEHRLIREVIRQRVANPDAAIVIYLHWSFDLEKLPFPMYRQFSRSLIDSGVNLVLGTHSHCIQGGEKYKNGYIVYGLGNFYLPFNIFAGSYLTFPDFARLQLAFEWDYNSNCAVCHWFEYHNNGNDHTLKHLSTEKFEDSIILSKHTPYATMSDIEYISFYIKNRRKKYLIPVYRDYKKSFTNIMFTRFLMMRASVAHSLAKMGLRKWQN